MKLTTDYRGEIEYSEDDIIYFEDGLYGLEDNKEFLLLANSEPTIPFYFLQSLNDTDYALLVTDPFLFVENYDFEINDAVLEKINLKKIEDVAVYNAVVIPNKIEDMTINLRAPFIINKKNKKAKQVILEDKYPLRQKLKRGTSC